MIPIETITENGTKSSNFAQCNEDHSNDEGGEISKGASIAHNYTMKEKLVIVFYIEAAGEVCGIVQISAQVFRMVHRNGVSESEILKETFNKYVQPGKEAIWIRGLALFMDYHMIMI